MTTEKLSKEIKAIEEFSFDEAHGFKTEKDGFCSEDMSFGEYCAVKDSGTSNESRINAAYKLGYMKGGKHYPYNGKPLSRISLPKIINEFDFDAEHGFEIGNGGYCNEDLTVREYMAIDNCAMEEKDRIYYAYIVGYMKGARTGLYSKRA